MNATTKTFLAAFLLCLFHLPVSGESPLPYELEQAFPYLQFELPLYITSEPQSAKTLYVVEQAGKIHAFPNNPDADRTSVVLDITRKVRRDHMEEGLLGFAFHPNFHKTRKAYIYYSTSKPRRTVLSEIQMGRFSRKFDVESERVIMEFPQPYGNHNGGMIAFGPDGYLYISVGDGGSAGDPEDRAQNPKSLLGKLLRIDVDNYSTDLPYGIPDSNPFRSDPSFEPEIFALGLRNVWRFSFDSKTGNLWAGDVGQNAWEEINLIEGGKNYGWNFYEGTHLYKKYKRSEIKTEFQPPIWEYNRDTGQSVTGGYVYRGKKHLELTGTYIFADFIRGAIWGFQYDGKTVNSFRQLAEGSHISSFGNDSNGSLYICQLFDGKIYKLRRKMN